ncbi:hypothetical protein [Chryseobacterium populi]|uniref:Uncharacterized protein n=1 Tax=Chryseobacterium populi TaxID=1144316 RepID=J3CLK1_9FLAO|nr:hypothetical protein [Chryseobacterium populi]EJL74034.1 hypothetical protein PMI13_01240 [Chryseobacterium populi]
MEENFREIHIGSMIRQCVADRGISFSRIKKVFKVQESDVQFIYEAKSMETELMLKWSKLLEYDLFRLYSQHLILYAPPVSASDKDSRLFPVKEKNIYTKEMIDFIIETLDTGKKTKKQVLEEYRIPKTTLHKWLAKYK